MNEQDIVKAWDEAKAQKEKDILEKIKNDGNYIRRILPRNRTPEMCLIAVKQDGFALIYIRTQTPELCLAAYNQNKRVLKYIDPEIIRQWRRNE